MVGVIVSVLAAALAGVLTLLAGLSIVIILAVAGIAFVAAFALVSRYAIARVVEFQNTLVSRFPTPPPAF